MKNIFLSLILLIITTAPAMAQMNTNRLENRLEKREEQVVAQQQKRAEFQEKIKAIKDQNKAKIAERINNQLEQINQRAITHFNNVLTRLTALLDKLEAKATNKEIVAGARSAIEAARTAVEEQSNKTYVIEFTEESGLKVGASAAKTNLKTDLKAVKDKVMAAREAVVVVLKTVQEAL